jgi:preprotein translocase subunit YajC
VSGSGGNSAAPILIFVVFAVGIYFLMIRPQQKRRREVESMQSAMGIGDEIVTVGGLYGTVVEVNDDTVLLQIAPGVTAKYARAAIGKVTQKAAAEEAAAEEESAGTADSD